MPEEVIVDDEVFRALQKLAVPLVDTPNSVIRRLLNLPDGESGISESAWPMTLAKQESPARSRRTRSSRARRGSPSRAKRPRAPKGVLLSEAEYELPLLEALTELGGRAPTRELLEALEKKLDGKLQPIDWETLASGNVRWKNRAQFVRLNLVRGGDMLEDSPRGTWEISEQGKKRVTAEMS